MDRKRSRDVELKNPRPTKLLKRKHGYIHSTLFQVPLEKRDIQSFSTPMNQHVENPMNCGAVSTQLLRMIPKAFSEELSKQNTPTTVDNWAQYMNTLVSDPTYYRIDSVSDISFAIGILRERLFEGFATLIGITRRAPSGEQPVGHFFVLANLRPGTFYLIDPQIQFSTDSNGVADYMRNNALNGDVYVITTREPHTRDEFQSQYVDHFLSNLVTFECSIGARRTKRRTTRRRKSGRK